MSEWGRLRSLFEEGERDPGLVAELLEEAAHRQASDVVEAALTWALGAWRQTPTWSLGELYGRYVEVVESEAAAELRAHTKRKIDDDLWLAVEKAGRELDRPALALTIHKTAVRYLPERTGCLERWAPDPEVARILTNWLDSLPIRSISSQPGWRHVLAYIDRAGDPRTLAQVRAFDPALLQIGETMREWLTAQLVPIAESLEARGLADYIVDRGEAMGGDSFPRLIGRLTTAPSYVAAPSAMEVSARPGREFIAAEVADIATSESLIATAMMGSGWPGAVAQRRANMVTVGVWSRETGAPVTMFALDRSLERYGTNNRVSVKLSHDGRWLAIREPGQVMIYEAESLAGEPKFVIPTHVEGHHPSRMPLMDVDIRDGVAMIVDVRQLLELRLEAGATPVVLDEWTEGGTINPHRMVVWSPDGKRLAYTAGQTTLRVIERGSEGVWRRLHAIRHHYASVWCWSSDSECLIFGRATSTPLSSGPNAGAGFEVMNVSTGLSRMTRYARKVMSRRLYIGLEDGEHRAHMLELPYNDQRVQWVADVRSFTESHDTAVKVSAGTCVSAIWDPTRLAWILGSNRGVLTWLRTGSGYHPPDMKKALSAGKTKALEKRKLSLGAVGGHHASIDGSVVVAFANATAVMTTPDGSKSLTVEAGFSDAVVSADGTRIALASGLSLKIFDATNLKAKPKSLPKLHGYSIQCVINGPDGGYITSGEDNLIVQLGSKGERVRELRGHAEFAMELALHPSERLLASLDIGGSIRVWDLDDGAQLFEHTEPEATAIGWDAAGGHLWMAADRRLVFRDVASDEVVAIEVDGVVTGLAPHPERSMCVAVATRGHRAFLVVGDGESPFVRPLGELYGSSRNVQWLRDGDGRESLLFGSGSPDSHGAMSEYAIGGLDD